MGALTHQESPIWPTNISSRSSFNASAFAALLQSSALNLKDYVWTEHERPLIAHNQFENDQLIPVVDLAAFTSVCGPNGSLLSGPEKKKAQRCAAVKMANASQEWGFFQITNHGISEELIKEMERHARHFFEVLSIDEKKKVLRDSNTNKPMGYACGGAGTRLKSDLPWIESLQFPSVSEEMEVYVKKIWQDENKEFRRVVKEFSEAMRRVSMGILEVLMAQLEEGGGGWRRRRRSWVVEEMVKGARNSVVRYNYYPPCPQPALTLGLGAHSDPHLLTLLHQDMVGGLQIYKDGRWMAVRPRADALVVNIGDALQVWSNDVYKSVEHRAVCNSVKSRLSMGFFLNPVDEAIISPSTTSLPLYKSFSWKDYRECLYTHRPRGKSNLQRFKL